MEFNVRHGRNRMWMKYESNRDSEKFHTQQKLNATWVYERQTEWKNQFLNFHDVRQTN